MYQFYVIVYYIDINLDHAARLVSCNTVCCDQSAFHEKDVIRQDLCDSVTYFNQSEANILYLANEERI